MTLSNPIATSGDAAGDLYAGERDGDAFVPIVGEDNGVAFVNGCLPGDNACRNFQAAATNHHLYPSRGLGIKFTALFPDELNEWRDNMCARYGRECDTRNGRIPDYSTGFSYTLGERAAVAGNEARNTFLAGIVGYHRDDASADDHPVYATLARWIFYAIDEDKRDRVELLEPDQNTIGYYERYGYSIFADNAVVPPSAGEADYQVAARVSYNAPFGDYTTYRWYAEKFEGRLTANFADCSIGGRLSRWLDHHLDFSGEISDACVDAAVCFSGTVRADFRSRITSTGHWEERFNGQPGTFTGAFYDDADSYDDASAPREIGGVFGGLFNQDGGELVGGFLGDLDDYIRPPSPPQNLAVRVEGAGDDGRAHLSWDIVPDAYCYYIYRDGVLIYSTATRNEVTYTDENAGAGDHSYTVVAYNGDGDSDPTDAVVARIPPEAPHFAQYDKIEGARYAADPARQDLPAADGGRRLADVYVNDGGHERVVKHLAYASYGMWNVTPSGSRPRDYEYVSFADHRPPSLPTRGAAIYRLEGDADYEGNALDFVSGELRVDFANRGTDAEILLSHASIANLIHPLFTEAGPREWGVRLRFPFGDIIDPDCGCYQGDTAQPINVLETIDGGTRMTLHLPAFSPEEEDAFGIFHSAFNGGGELLGNFHDAPTYDPASGNAPAEVSGHFSSGENHSGEQIKGAFLGDRTRQSGIE